jgi:hypothetical protein
MGKENPTMCDFGEFGSSLDTPLAVDPDGKYLTKKR